MVSCSLHMWSFVTWTHIFTAVNVVIIDGAFSITYTLRYLMCTWTRYVYFDREASIVYQNSNSSLIHDNFETASRSIFPSFGCVRRRTPAIWSLASKEDNLNARSTRHIARNMLPKYTHTPIHIR
ncbi:hypothetical protein DMENIID0001_078860 [Sergentomyia squamirostris]